MLKKLKLCMLACRIEWHWLFIMPGRKKGSRIINHLLEKEQPINSPELMKLNRRMSRRCTRVSVLTERYISLAGI